VTRSERLTAKTKLAAHEIELAQIAENNVAKKEFDKKEGIAPAGWSREERWNDYVKEEERKKADEEKGKKESMFKDYNDLVDSMAVSQLLYRSDEQMLIIDCCFREDLPLCTLKKAMRGSATRVTTRSVWTSLPTTRSLFSIWRCPNSCPQTRSMSTCSQPSSE
jgi:polyphosphate kinase